MMTPVYRTTALLLAFAFPAVAQDEKTPDPEVQAKIEEFDDAYSDRKMERDAEAVGLMDELLSDYESYHPKDQSKFLKALDGVFKARKRKPDNPGLYRATVTTLGKIGGPDAARILVRAYDRKPFSEKEWLSTREDMLENIGLTLDPKQIDFLVKTAVRDPVDGIKRAAGGALRHYGEMPQKVRREIFKKVLVDYGKIEGDSRSSLDPGNAVAQTRKRTLNAIQDTWNGTLSAMSGHTARTAEEWQRWWNDYKNKKKAWK